MDRAWVGALLFISFPPSPGFGPSEVSLFIYLFHPMIGFIMQIFIFADVSFGSSFHGYALPWLVALASIMVAIIALLIKRMARSLARKAAKV